MLDTLLHYSFNTALLFTVLLTHQDITYAALHNPYYLKVWLEFSGISNRNIQKVTFYLRGSVNIGYTYIYT